MLSRKLWLCLIILIPAVNYGQYPLDSLLKRLDEVIVNHEIYTSQKEQRIENLKGRLSEVSQYSIDGYELNAEIFEEYRPFILDSAIRYMNLNIQIAGRLQDHERLSESKIKLAALMGSTGMYTEAVDLLQSINRYGLPEHLVIEYFNTYRHVYSELAFYTQYTQVAQDYWDISNLYRDSLNQFLTPEYDIYDAIREDDLRNSGETETALRLNGIRLENSEPGTRDYAIACYNRSLIYRVAGNLEGEKYYLALSALSDIMSSTKDHASLWMIAEILYDEGDMERAYNYIRFSWNETVYYNARLRSLQSARILSLIDQTYQATVEKKNDQLQKYLVMISALLVLIAFALVYIYSQMRRLAVTRMNLQVANDNLKILNLELQQVNRQMQVVNLDLSESNHIKEEYIGHFIRLCSLYIDKIDEFRRMVNKKLTAGQTSELLDVIRSRDMLETEIEELYRDFDKAFLRIFPHFVEKVNELFYENEKIVLKHDELLNVELRILALIRLGITNSSQIADFMRYSVNTIYNYRAKIKNKTAYRDEFEELIMKIR
ncbi:hypothetical protein BA6E_1147 [Bacteroidales bacterium 6E]|nr:hypothetical protein BA6E_1147 [Bacteroidales bacterium 6E]